MMHYLLLGLILPVSLILQSTLFEYIKIADVKPDLLLVTTIFYGLLYGKGPAARLGFIYGLIEDLFIGKYIGINGLTKMTVGYLIGLGESKIYKDHILVPILALFIGTIVHQVIFLFLGDLMGARNFFVANNFLVIGASAVYNSCLGLFFYGKYHEAAVRNHHKSLTD